MPPRGRKKAVDLGFIFLGLPLKILDVFQIVKSAGMKREQGLEKSIAANESGRSYERERRAKQRARGMTTWDPVKTKG